MVGERSHRSRDLNSGAIKIRGGMMSGNGKSSGHKAQSIDITDLLHPVLTPLQQSILAAAEATPFTLSEDAVLRAACEQTGLSNFGPDDFRERLRTWLLTTDEDPGATALSTANIFGECV